MLLCHANSPIVNVKRREVRLIVTSIQFVISHLTYCGTSLSSVFNVAGDSFRCIALGWRAFPFCLSVSQLFPLFQVTNDVDAKSFLCSRK